MSRDLHPVTDPEIVETAVEVTPEWLAHLAVFLTQLGSVFFVVPVVVAAYWYDPGRFSHWIPAVVGYYSVMAGIKSLNGADRPDAGPPVDPGSAPELFAGTYEHAATISTTSFPSGNVIAATVLAGLFVLDTRVWTRRRRLLAAAVYVVVVGYTRLGLGVHYPVDVVGGVAIGLAWLGAVELVRDRSGAGDPTAALFALAAVLAAVALWLRTGLWGPPTAEPLVGSNRPVALGAALGGLAAWTVVRDRPEPTGRGAVAASVLALVAVFVGGLLVRGVVTHPVVVVPLAAVAFAAVVVTPWALPGRPFRASPSPDRGGAELD